MSSLTKRILSLCMALVMVLSIAIPQASALSYSGSSSYKSGKYYTRLKNVELTGNQRVDIVNIAKSQVGYQEGASSSKLSGEVKGSGNYTEYGRWYGMQDMWCAMFVSWCANVAGVSTSIIPSHSYTPSGLYWFIERGRAYSRSTVANGGYTPQAGDIIYFKSSRNKNITNHIGIVTGYSNGTVYTIEGNTSSATISTNGGAVCEKSYSINNTYIVYICKPAYKNTASSTTTTTSSTSWLSGSAKEVVFDAEYYLLRYPALKSQVGTTESKLFDYFMNTGLKEGHAASPIFDVKYYVANNADVQESCGTDYVAAMKHFISTGINEARVGAEPLDLGDGFQARIGYPAAGLNFSLSDTNVITYNPSDKPAQVWTFYRHPSGSYRIVNSKNGYSLAVAGYEPQSDVSIAEYKDSRRQLWYIYEAADGRYVFRSMAASDCVLDVYGASTAALTDIWTYNYNGSAAQQFTIDKLTGLKDLTPVDIGTDFYARIGASDGINLSLVNTNVITYGESDARAQVWWFDRQDDGTYEIANQKTGDLLDVCWANELSGSKVQIFQDHDNEAQRWYIYQSGSQYILRPACSDTCVLDVSGSDTDTLSPLQTYVANASAEQRFSIKRLDSCLTDNAPADLGEQFTARINASEGMDLSLNGTNVVIGSTSNTLSQLWSFTRQTDGSYEIMNLGCNKALDVYDADDISGTNVHVYKDNDTPAQRWFIYQHGEEYIFRPAVSTGRVLDVAGGSTADQTNVQIYSYNATDAQWFGITVVDESSVLNTPVNLGNDFFAKINASEGMNLSLSGDNVIIYGDSSALAQVWKFSLQADGSYKIVNQKNGMLLDVYWAKDESGTNVQVYPDNESNANKWFIYSSGDQYILRPACSESRVLEVEGNGTADLTNVHINDYADSDAQKFSIVTVDGFADLGTPADLGTDFFAKINASEGMNLSLSGDNVILYGDSAALAQIWKFERQTNGSYKIINQKNGKVLDVYAAADASGTNVQVYADNDSNAQKWYIYQTAAGYVFRPACSYSCVLDVEGNGTADLTNVQIYAYSGSEAQAFDIVSLDNYVDLGIPADLGSEFYAKINSSEGMNLSLYDTSVIIYGDSSAAAQVWKFERQTNGSYKITNQKNGLVLDVIGAADTSGTNLQIYESNDTAAQRWYIYRSGDEYIFRPAMSHVRVMDVEGGSTAAMAEVQIYSYNGSDAQKFGILVQEGYAATGTSSENLAVLRKIMYAVETGGQVYGQCDYTDFTEAYTNSSEEHAITIGAGQWYGVEAKTLLNLIRETDYATFSALDTAGIEYDLDNADWSTYKLTKGSAKAKCIQSIISSAVGIKCQDQLMDEQLIKYMNEAAALGVTEESAQMMCANIRHQGGLSAVKRVLAKTEQPYTIHTIYEAMQSDTGNQVGTYRSRQKMVYNSLLEYLT